MKPKREKKKKKWPTSRSLQPRYYSYTFLITEKTIPVRKEERKKKNKTEETARLLVDKGARAGTAKLVLDIINTQKNDAR